MIERTFIDTNVWVYAADGADRDKQQRAIEAIGRAADAGIVLSAQVLGEFYVTVTRRLATPMSPANAAAAVRQMARFPLVAVDGGLVEAAIAGSQTWQLSYWDALLIAAARRAGVSRMVSEDLADGATYASVRIESPFRDR